MIRRWLEAWDVFLVIMLTGTLAGLITFMATDPAPAACHRALAPHAVVRSMAWVCQHP